MASEHQQAERALRDRDAAAYDSWYRRTKGVGFDVREVSLVTAQAGDGHGLALDVGGGTGRVARALRRSGRIQVVIVDLSEASLQLARSNGSGIGVQASAAEGLPVRPASFEVITACQVLQHLDENELAAALVEFRRAVRPGGTLVIAGYNGAARRYAAVREERYDNGLWAFRRHPDAVASAASRAGFSLDAERFYSLLPLHRLPAALGVSLDRLVCSIRPAALNRAGYVVQRYAAT